MSGRVNKIVKRYYYAVELRLRSPLALSGGENETTDMDVLKNGNGEAFIPGTSVAGAFRSYLNKKKDQDGSFGYTKGDVGRMSAVSISDIYFQQTPTVSVRDGVQLSERRQVVNKFDMEVIEPGVTGILYLDYVLRENDTGTNPEQEMTQLLSAMEQGEIRFGKSKNRGYGRLEIVNIRQESFLPEQVEKWVSFNQKFHDLSAYSDRKTYAEWMRDALPVKSQYDIFRIPLKLTGGISIRKYSTQPEKADYEHITSNGKPIIPGTSWTGAIRADAREILLQLGCSAQRCQEIIDQWFGYVETTSKKKDTERANQKAQQSMVVVGESVLEDSVSVPMTRNKINRFDASTIESALYSEITCCQGTTGLEIMVKKESRDYHALLAILELIVQDICKGYVAVGGQTAIGRGIFMGTPDGMLDAEMRKKCQQALLDLIEGQGDRR